MLELLFVSDVVRQKTRESLATDVRAKPMPKRDPRRHAVRSGSAAALRGLADLIDPSRADVIAN